MNLLDGLDDEEPAPAPSAGKRGLLDGLDDEPSAPSPATHDEGPPTDPGRDEVLSLSFDRSQQPPPKDQPQPNAGMRFLGGLSRGAKEGLGFPGTMAGDVANAIAPPYSDSEIARPGPKMAPRILDEEQDPAAQLHLDDRKNAAREVAMTAAGIHPATRIPMLIGGLGMQAHSLWQNPSAENIGETIGGLGGGELAGRGYAGVAGSLATGQLHPDLQPLVPAVLRQPPKMGVVPPEMAALRGRNAVPQGPMPQLPSGPPPAAPGSPAGGAPPAAMTAPAPAAAPAGPSPAQIAIEALRSRATQSAGARGAIEALEREAAATHPTSGGPATLPGEPGPGQRVPPQPQTTRPAMVPMSEVGTPDTRILKGAETLAQREHTSPKEHIGSPTQQRPAHPVRVPRLPAGEGHGGGAIEPPPAMMRELAQHSQKGNLPQPSDLEERFGPGARVLRGHTVIRGDPGERMIPTAAETPPGTPEERSAWHALEVERRVLGDDAATITKTDGDVIQRVMNGKASPGDIETFQKRPDMQRFAWRLGKLQEEAGQIHKVIGKRNPWEMVSKDIHGLSSSDRMLEALGEIARADPAGVQPTPYHGVSSKNVTGRPVNALTGLRAQALASAHAAELKPALQQRALAGVLRDLQMLSELRATVPSDKEMSDLHGEALEMNKNMSRGMSKNLAKARQEVADAHGAPGITASGVAKAVGKGVAAHAINVGPARFIPFLRGLGAARVGQKVMKEVTGGKKP